MSFIMSKMKKCGECDNENNLAFENIIGCWAHPQNDAWTWVDADGVSRGTDIITIVLSDKNAFPVCGYSTTIDIKCQQGKGADFIRTYWGVEPDQIISDQIGVIK